MRKIFRAGILGLGALVIYRLIAKAKAIGGLIFEIAKINFSLTADGIILTLMVNVRNDKDQGILLNEIRGKIFINDLPAGSVNTQPFIRIDPDKITVVPISVLVAYGPVFEILQKIILGNRSQAMNLRLEGTAKIEDINFPVNLTYTIA